MPWLCTMAFFVCCRRDDSLQNQSTFVSARFLFFRCIFHADDRPYKNCCFGDCVSPLTTWILLQLIYGEVISDIERHFSIAGYRFMPIKGAYLIKTGLAVSIQNRKMVDIDLLIPQMQFTEICEWFALLPNVIPKENYWDFERSYVYTKFGNPVYLEFHRLINFPARFLLPNELLFKRGITVSEACILPDPTDALLIHICHKLAHVIDGFEEQFYREITMYAEQQGFSWEAFWKRAKETEIIGFIWLVIEKWKRIKSFDISLPPAPSLYSHFLATHNLFMRSRSSLARKIFFEVPFVRNIFELIRYKLKKR